MTGISSYSTTASENVNANTGINWDEGMAPAAVNNSARQNMADSRSRWNDAAWFQYGIGSKTVAAVYSSGTAFTLAGADATAYWHTGRRVKAVGSTTGTIYGSVSSSSYATSTTTVNVVWDSGSLSNESLTIYAGTAQVTGQPIPAAGVAWAKTNDNAATGSIGEYVSLSIPTGSAVPLTNGTPADVGAISLSAGDWDVEGTVLFIPNNATVTDIIEWTSATSVTLPTPPNNGGLIHAAVSLVGSSSGLGYSIGRQRFSLANTTTIYLSTQVAFGAGSIAAYGFIDARRVR